MYKVRQWTEIGKMMEALKKNAPKKSFLMDEIDMTIYEEVKELYFRNILHIDETVDIDLSLDEDTTKALYLLADERGVPIDEIINEALEQKVNKCSGYDGYPQYEYRYLDLNEILEEGDEKLTGGTTKWEPVDSTAIGLPYLNFLVKVRRKFNIKSEDKYYYLKLGEVMEDGDEYKGVKEPDSCWRTIPNINDVYVNDMAVVRRKINKEQQYHILNIGEIKQEGDEFFDCYWKNWCITIEEGTPVTNKTDIYRRKI